MPSGQIFRNLQPQAPDALLSLIGLFRNDMRPTKIDLGVGVYRNAHGATPVFAAVKAAEHILQRNQDTKSYLGPEGDLGFLDRIRPIVFGTDEATDDLVALQTPGGTGALRLAAELANAARPGTRIWLGTPSWPIHAPIFTAAGLDVARYRYFDPETQALCFDEMLDAFGRADAGDIVLLHGCCHNPSGADPSPEQWAVLIQTIVERGLIPLVDLAYQGLGAGLDADAAGLRMVMHACDNVMVAYSCDKNFGLYRERVGALFVRARHDADLVRSNLLQLARGAWSMPPDHGAAVVRVILEDEALTLEWRDELEAMRLRLRAVRCGLAAAASQFGHLTGQHGLFALLSLSSEEIMTLRRDHGIYMAGSGRINLAGLNEATIPIFVDALEKSRHSKAPALLEA